MSLGGGTLKWPVQHEEEPVPPPHGTMFWWAAGVSSQWELAVVHLFMQCEYLCANSQHVWTTAVFNPVLPLHDIARALILDTWFRCIQDMESNNNNIKIALIYLCPSLAFPVFTEFDKTLLKREETVEQTWLRMHANVALYLLDVHWWICSPTLWFRSWKWPCSPAKWANTLNQLRPFNYKLDSHI